MVGREIKIFLRQPAAAKDGRALQGAQPSAQRYPGKTVSFDAARGEILGFAGLVGAGRSEMAQGDLRRRLDASPARKFCWTAKQLPIGTPRDAIEQGIYLVPGKPRAGGPRRGNDRPRKHQPAVAAKFFAVGGLINFADTSARSSGARQVVSLKSRRPAVETRVLNSERRQPAKSRARQMARHDAEGDDFGRADARHRRRGEGGNLPADARAGRQAAR